MLGEHEKHALTGVHGDNKTWCGLTRLPGEWVFTDATHAILNARNQGRLVLCRECALSIIAVLKAQHGW